MALETWVQSLIESYQRLKRWYFMPPCLTLNIISYRSRVKCGNPEKEVAPTPTVAIEQGTFGWPSTRSPTLIVYSLCIQTVECQMALFYFKQFSLA